MTEAKICENHLKTGGEQLEFKHKVSGTNEVSSRCREVFEELKIRRKHRYIIFHIGDEAVDVESVGERGKVKMHADFSFIHFAIADFSRLSEGSAIY